MTPPTFSIIFVNYRSAGHLAQSLTSWKKAFDTMLVEWIVVNNDDTESEMLDRLAAGTSLRVVSTGGNYGFGRACNVGAQQAKGTYLLFLNPDTKFFSGDPQELLEVFRLHPRSLGGVALIDQRGRDERWSAGRFPTLGRLISQQFFPMGRQKFCQRKNLTFPDWVSGAGLVVPRKIFTDLGGFDEKFFLYFEDVDLCQRAHRAGVSVWRSPFFVVQHVGGASQGTQQAQKQAYFTSQKKYFVKHRPRWESRILVLLQQLFLGLM